MATPVPTELNLHKKSRILEIHFDDGSNYRLPCQYLRVYSPSAEVQGHGPGQAVLQTDKENVTVTEIRPVGNYAIVPVFSDGHDSGIYSWELLYQLAINYDSLWADYLDRLKKAGSSTPHPK